MQDYLIVKGQIAPIKTENPPERYKPNEWQKLDRIVRHDSDALVGVSVLHSAIMFDNI